jgi:hypothetical protein
MIRLLGMIHSKRLCIHKCTYFDLLDTSASLFFKEIIYLPPLPYCPHQQCQNNNAAGYAKGQSLLAHNAV